MVAEHLLELGLNVLNELVQLVVSFLELALRLFVLGQSRFTFSDVRAIYLIPRVELCATGHLTADDAATLRRARHLRAVLRSMHQQSTTVIALAKTRLVLSTARFLNNPRLTTSNTRLCS